MLDSRQTAQPTWEMSKVLTKRLRDKVVTCSFPVEDAAVAKAQIQDIVAYHAANFSPHKSFMDQMDALAFDCYVQGLIDGEQLCIEPLVCRNEAGWPDGTAKCRRWCGMNYCQKADGPIKRIDAAKGRESDGA